MSTKPKIKIVDNSFIRNRIDDLYETTNQILLAKWSLSIAKHALLIAGIDYKSIDIIKEGFKVNELWQSGKARMHDVRQSGFKVHKLAREMDNEINKTALRVVGQAIGSGHMREHSLIASDYAIKLIGLLYENDFEEISKEREWQLNKLIGIIKSNEQTYKSNNNRAALKM